MAGDHLDAIARIDDLIAMMHFNSICYIVQARVQRPRVSNIATDTFSSPTCIFSSEIHAWRTTTMRVQYSHSWTHEPDYEYSRVKHYLWSRWQVPHGRIAIYRKYSLSVRFLDGNSILSTSQLDSVYVKPCTQPVAPRMRGNLSSNW